MVLLLRKVYLYFTKDPEALHYMPGGRGVQLFPGGSNFYRNPYTYLLFSIGGCPDPILWVVFQIARIRHYI